ncbi:MAG: M23 family metallopeptidase [Polyangiaceae bacterium]|nr:M23 family metallopeptidase [Polyangiaceae bacterium]
MLVSGSGEGRFDEKVYVPNMRFPIETGPAYLNSQVWGHGGSQGPGGSQCDPENRQYPWWDNYCEKRTWDMPLCPAGTGHQGQDMRAADCEKNVHWVVAGVDGTITNVGTYSVYLTADDGTRFDYLHMGSVQVAVGDEVKRGDRLGKVSNEFGGTPTTIHLHFNIRQDVEGLGFVYVPPYLSLVKSYQELMSAPPEGTLESATCERIFGAAADADTPDEPADVHISVGGPAGEKDVLGFDVKANLSSGLYCAEGEETCTHGFDSMLPVRLLDGANREVYVYAKDTWGGSDLAPLAGSPKTVTCLAFSTDGKVRRKVAGDAQAWAFDTFFDEWPIRPQEIDDLPSGRDLPSEPKLVTSADAADFWMFDGVMLRSISADALFAFRLDPKSAAIWEASDVARMKKGKPWPSRPVIVFDANGETYLLDDRDDGLLSLGGNGEDDPETQAKESGCTCTLGAFESRNGGASAAAFALIGLLLSARRRRTNRANS